MPSVHDRIAIIGAGPAGLTAARALRQLGYRQVVVFEAAPRPGGKVRTVLIDGHPIELGAIWLMPEYRFIRGLAEELGVALAPDPRRLRYLGPDGGWRTPFAHARQRHGLLPLLRALWRLHRLLDRRLRGLRAPGHQGLDRELASPLTTWLAEHDLTPLADLLFPCLMGCGYGFGEEVPAAYHLKLVDLLLHGLPRDLIGLGPLTLHIPGGMQSLWDALARTVEVRLGCPVTRIERGGGADGTRISLTTPEGTEQFDRLIVATSPLDLREILECSPAEQHLFLQLRTCRYRVTVLRLARLPRGMTLFFTEHVHPDRRGHVLVLDQEWAATELWVAYQQLSPDASPDEPRRLLRDDVARVGGQLRECLLEQDWTYFPHVGPAAYAAGFHNDLEKVQGVMATWYVGGVASFESVEHAARHADHLIRRWFGPPQEDAR